MNCREVLRKLDRNYNFDNKHIVVDLSSHHAYERFLSQVSFHAFGLLKPLVLCVALFTHITHVRDMRKKNILQ